jgi:hypothetical protein
LFGDKRDNSVIVAIVTDGFENASALHSLVDVKDRVDRAHAKDWRVTFLGANQDAVMLGERMGIRRDRSLTYGHTMEGAREAFHSMRMANARYHSGDNEAYTNRERIVSNKHHPSRPSVKRASARHTPNR